MPDHAGFCGVSSLDNRAIVLYVKWGLRSRNSESSDTLVQAETGMRRRPLTQQLMAPRLGLAHLLFLTSDNDPAA